ncbi:M23 family metallopeptidase [Microvirga subterranea]|uniref:Murein DD-endopeptidase MepM/ murein hydrolase activator NlpD n=1 Tax=Microvirga subterranea TaxID=186651 RepID=A0A370H636_9HYPH|nr:M23 family metallopeptidase [Microvirga subterranea]RDI51272.1 murein DD-endopeptidase MepM/ murein hydrolase activator NlpD [Microvirga subterranea]
MSHIPSDDDRTTGSRREISRASSGIDLGHEPPLNPSGGDASEIDRRGVNVRWLGASVLTGVTGAVLIGASIYIALEGATTSANPPERAALGPVRSGDDREHASSASRKADRLNLTENTVLARQSFKAPMTIRNGDREAIKVRQFVRIATNLSLSTGTYATDIPPFNPMRLFADAPQERPPEPQPEVADADVSVVRQDLTPIAIEASAPALSDDDVLAMLEEDRRLSAEAGRQSAVPIPAQQMLSRTLKQPDGLGDALGYARIVDAPFSTIEVRVVPENVTSLPKVDQRAAGPLVEEREIILKKGETLETALRSYGATPDQIQAITNALSARIKVAALGEGQRLRVLIAPGPLLGDPRQIVRVLVFGEKGIEAIAATNDRGLFVSVAPPEDRADSRTAVAQEEEAEDDGRGVRLYESLYETAMKNDLPRQTVEELVRIFGYDLDFQRRVSPGDSFEIFFGSDDEDGPPEVLYAALSVGGESRRVYRYQGDDGTVDFFDEAGRSLKKFLLRKPITDGILRSGFGSRNHPILGYTRPHTGVDWANRIGTPILAAGNGTVLKAQWDSGGYGRRVEIQHTNGYVTAYSHMSSFGKGIVAGTKVQQGQVIGYVGNTGLSTGPHLHYEVIINGSFVDPLKIRLPRGRELEGRGLAEFKRQREQVDELMTHATGASASLSQRAELR